MDPGVIAVLIPILVPIGAFVMVYFLNKQENETKQKMIENGMNPKDLTKKSGRPTPNALKFGGLLVGAGLGLFIATIMSSYMSINDGNGLYFGLIGLLGGVGLILAHNYARKQYQEDEERKDKRDQERLS